METKHLRVREANDTDLDKGLWDIVNVFRFRNDDLSSVTLEEKKEMYKKALMGCNAGVTVFVVTAATDEKISDEKVVGTAKLIVEPKLHHRGAAVAHVEDVAVDPSVQGHGVGSLLLATLREEAKARGAYKIILNATEKVKGFYLKNGFSVLGHEMGIRLID